MRLGIKLVCLAGLLAFLTAGCTRKQGNTATIRLSFGDMNNKGARRTQSFSPDPGTYIDVIVINVSGPSIPAGQGFYQWQYNHNSVHPNSPPSTINLTVPQGSALVQALVVEGSSNGGSGGFFYGDVTQDLNSANPDVPVTVGPLGGVDATGSNNIAGRYLKADGTGPTGKILVYYQPPGGKPEMLVDNGSEIFGGWFRIFAIQGASLRYMTSDGVDLMNGPVSINSSSLVASGSHSTMTVSMPAFYRSEGNGGTMDTETASTSVFGWFGPGAGSKPICYFSDTEAIPYAYTANNTSSAQIEWDGTPNPSAGAAHVTSGGLASDSLDGNGFCNDNVATHTLFVDYMAFLDKQAVSNDQVLGFKGPFQEQFSQYGGSNMLSSSLSGTTLNLSWVFLPGVQSGPALKAIDGVDLYGRMETSANNNGGGQDYNDSEGNVQCGNLTSLTDGANFTLLGNYTAPGSGSNMKVGVGLGTTPNLNVSVPVDLSSLPSFVTKFNSGLTTIIACPYQTSGLLGMTKNYFSTAAVAYPNGNTGCGSNCGLPAATSLALVSPQEIAGITHSIGTVYNSTTGNTCTPFIVRGISSGTAPGSLPGGFNFNLTINGLPTTNAYFSNNSNCGTNAFSSGAGSGQWLNSSDQMIWLNFYGNGLTPVNGSFTVSLSGGAFTSPTYTLNYQSLSSPPDTAFSVKMLTASSVYQYACSSMTLQSWYDDTTIAMLATPTSGYVNYQLPTPVGMQYYNNNYGPGCSSNNVGTASNSLSSYNLSQQLSYSYSGTASPLALVPTLTPTDIVASGTTSVTVTAPGAPDHLMMNVQSNSNGMNNFQVVTGTCTTVTVNVQDSQGNATASAGGVNFNISTTGGGMLYTSPGCYSGGTASFSGMSIVAPLTSQTFYFSSTTAGAGTISVVSASALPGPAAPVAQLTINPPDTMVAYVTGQSYVQGTGVLGTSMLPFSAPGTLYLCFENHTTHTIDTSINGSSYLSTVNATGISGSLPSGYNINLSNGCASLPITATSGVVSVNAYGNVNGNAASLMPTNFSVVGAPDQVVVLLNGAAFAPIPPGAAQVLGQLVSGGSNNYKVCYMLPDGSAIDTSVSGIGILASTPMAYQISDSADSLTAGCTDGSVAGCGSFTNGCASSSLNVPAAWSGATAWVQVWGAPGHASMSTVGTYVQ